jgi:hypothetical protein
MRKTNKKISSRISKNVKIGINQQEMLNDFNIRINKKLKEFNSSSETTRATSFNEWLGGLMDSDGCFSLSKKNYLCCEITVPIREISGLYKIKAKFGGSISYRTATQAVRWRLHKKELLYKFLLALNGNIHTKFSKYAEVMALYAPDVIAFKKDLTFYNAWLSGFFEGDGCVNLNRANYNLILSISQKNKNILDKIKYIYGGNIYFDKSWNGYSWQASNKKDLISLFEYFTLYPLKSIKNSDIFSAKKFFRYKLQGYHLIKSKQTFLNHFITIFQRKKI